MHPSRRGAFPLVALLLTEACYSAHPITTPPPSGVRIEVQFVPRRRVVLNREGASDTAFTAVALYGRLREQRGDTLIIALNTVQPEFPPKIRTSEARVTTRIVPGPGINVLESRPDGPKTLRAVLAVSAGFLVLSGLILLAWLADGDLGS